MKEKSLNMFRKDRVPRKGALSYHFRLGRKSLRASGFDRLPDPAFLINAKGALMDVNAEGAHLMANLPAEGNHGSVGRRELVELFSRAAVRDVAPAPLCIDTLEGAHHYEARFAPKGKDGMKAIVFSDVTIWKRALSEKDAILHAIRTGNERPISVCARCGAIKSPSGDWTAIGDGASSAVPRERMSHGLCPDCLTRELGQLGMSTAEARSAATQAKQSQ